MQDDASKSPESALKVTPGVAPRERVIKPRVKRKRLEVAEHIEGVRRGDRAIIGRTLSLMESANPDHREKAEQVLENLLPYTGQSIRLGITGVPGVGKSTFIEALGTLLTEQGHKVAVLAVDPSSELSGGSILGDKTRMEKLSRNPRALVRPSACGGWLGGVARGTRESILIVEAAGYDVVIVETVGVGQSETQVASMVDFFLLLMIAGGGDELQGIKRGIVEMADAIAINKADGDNIDRTRVARNQAHGALRLLRPQTEGWEVPVLMCSSITGLGIDEIWKTVERHRGLLEDTGKLQEKRSQQALYWMKQAIEYYLIDHFYRHPGVAEHIGSVRQEVLKGKVSPFSAAERLVRLAGGEPGKAGS